jgi:dTDP-4-amino-4,6-dideoxygalactose transaminase
MPRGYAKQMSAFQRRLLETRLGREGQVEQRRRLRDLYEDVLRRAGLPTLRVHQYADPVLLRYPIRVSQKARVLAEARRRQVELGDWFDHPLHPRGANIAILGWRDGLCPEGTRAAREVVNLPMHAGIREREVERVMRLVQPHVLSWET